MIPSVRVILWLAVFAATLVAAGAQTGQRRSPGSQGKHALLLPNGWTITPAGEQIPVGDLPLALALHPDGKCLLVLHSGYSTQSIALVDLEKRSVVHEAVVKQAWLGLGFGPDGKTVYAGGGKSNSVLVFGLEGSALRPLSPMRVGPADIDLFSGGLCITRDRLYVANNQGGSVSALDPASGRWLAEAKVGMHPYTCVAAQDGRSVFVSLWGESAVVQLDAASLKVIGRISTDDHPNAMLFSADGKRLFVANANSNTVSAIDLSELKAVERISVTLYPGSPAGSTTNALALSPDGKTLYAANADNNDVAVIDITAPGQSKVLGFIPVGWYPTALAVSPDGRMLYVANGKGGRSFANPRGPRPTQARQPETEYIGKILGGTVSVIPIPDAALLALYTKQVYDNVPYSERKRLVAPFSGRSAIPRRVGDNSPIRHVIYVIKENRTYDQIFGDMKEGNGDPALTLFGEEITPNHHALAREFVLLDNFYVDSEVSADGHNWSMGAYATDYVEKTWPSNYSARRSPYDFEGTNPTAAPSAGYIWDACLRAGVSFRVYGEWVSNGPTLRDPGTPRVAALKGHIDPWYRAWDLNYSDVSRTKRFLDELSRFEKEGDMPRFQIVRLGNDHTQGTTPGALTPRSYVAQNDLALGMLIEGISRSKFWADTAVFVVEDDAQNGPDHVDAHRSIALAISPYIRRRTVDSTMYSTCSILRTMELILGLPPMSQYDAAAAPLFASFGTSPDQTPYQHRQARVSLTDVNPRTAPLAKRSMELSFAEADAAPDIEFNEIIWKSVKGVHSVMPAPVRTAFVRPID